MWSGRSGVLCTAPQEVLRLIRAQAGDSTSPMLRFLLRCVLALTPDPFAASVRRLKALRIDMGRSFDSHITAETECAVVAAS